MDVGPITVSTSEETSGNNNRPTSKYNELTVLASVHQLSI